MVMNKVYYLVALWVIVLVGFSVSFYYGGNVISGEVSSDFGNCLIASGFYWNESEMACVRDLPEGVEGERYQVVDYFSCIAAGYPILESYPRRCEAPRGAVFVYELDKE